MSAVLAFQSTTFETITRNDEPWVRGPQIEAALGFKKTGAVRMIYDRHADEFTPSMTAVITLPTPGGPQETRIFSLRGCHLLAMFARTPVAKAFRVWVLDVLETLNKPAQPALPETVTPSTPAVRKKTPAALPYDPTQQAVDEQLAKVRFYIKEIGEAEKRVFKLLCEKKRREHPELFTPDIAYSDPRRKFYLGISTTTRYLWSAIDSNLQALHDSITVQIKGGIL